MQFAPLYPLLYRVLAPAFPNCLWSGKPGDRAIALSFDDGPHPQHTPAVLEVLRQHQIQASFFCLGIWVQQYPEIAKAIVADGHWIGLHGYTHHNFARLSAQQLHHSLWDTQAAIAKACGLDPQLIRDVRPPNGLFTPRTLKLLQQWHYRPVMWSVVPEDWERPGISRVTQRVITQTQPGSLIVLHDGPHGGQDCAPTLANLIPRLIAANYRFITVDELWQTTG